MDGVCVCGVCECVYVCVSMWGWMGGEEGRELLFGSF